MTRASRSEKILIVRYDDGLRPKLCDTLLRHGFDVDFVPELESGLQSNCDGKYAIAIVDLSLSGSTGLETVARIADSSPNTEIIVLATRRNFDLAQRAIGHQVFDCVVKPVSTPQLLRTVREASNTFSAKREKEVSLSRLLKERAQLEDRIKIAGEAIQSSLKASQLLLGQSEGIRRVRRQIAVVAPSSMTVLILGENGTGKDVVANLIHRYSGRPSSNRMVKVNCPAVPESLIESEFFGHEDGAFTGATRRKPGRFDLADGGTIFLDEIATISMPVQAKLLQVVEHRKFMRVGGSDVLHVDTRILAATNSNLEEMIESGDFRADLYYRLKQFTITLPPLREQKEDIPLLIDAFLRDARLRYGNEGVAIPGSLLKSLELYSWPGNVRELRALIERFVLTGDATILAETVEEAPKSTPVATLSNALEDGEATAVRLALIKTNWNRKRAAQLLGISYSSIRRRIEKYDLLNQTSRIVEI